MFFNEKLNELIAHLAWISFSKSVWNVMMARLSLDDLVLII